MTKVIDRIALLQECLDEKGIDAYLINGSDPHMSEYAPERWETREWITGFNGSAGFVIVTKKEVCLWVDSRYYLQAETQIKGTGIELFKSGQKDVPTEYEYLLQNKERFDTIAFDGTCFSYSQYKKIRDSISKEATIKSTDLLEDIWKDRPSFPEDKAYILDEKDCGLSASAKIKEVLTKLKTKKAQCTIISGLDEIAWVLNMRGSDVDYNPVFLSHLIINNKKPTLYIHFEKLDEESQKFLKKHGVAVKEYKEIFIDVAGIKDETIYFDPDRVSYSIITFLDKSNKLIEGTSLPYKLKGIKNEVEIENMRETLIQDGIAMVKFLYWLENEADLEDEDEISVAEKLSAFRAENEYYVGDSFATIAGYAANGAIVHYNAHNGKPAKLKKKGFLLLDSGGQYKKGTTDITRTIALGELSDTEKKDYTLVLKGHINLARSIFPDGANGSQIDALARIPLWRHGLNYGHGTGHGIGYFLNVHEGPAGIRPSGNYYPISENMIFSNEPGIYRTGSHGVRLENLILVKKSSESEFGVFLSFETITFCPIDHRPIIVEMLNEEEKDWINNYHQKVYDKLYKHLDEKEKLFLKEKIRYI